jgi:hypothetical protein
MGYSRNQQRRKKDYRREKKGVTIHQKRKRFSGKELRHEFQMACLKSVPFTTR